MTTPVSERPLRVGERLGPIARSADLGAIERNGVGYWLPPGTKYMTVDVTPQLKRFGSELGTINNNNSLARLTGFDAIVYANGQYGGPNRRQLAARPRDDGQVHRLRPGERGVFEMRDDDFFLDLRFQVFVRETQYNGLEHVLSDADPRFAAVPQLGIPGSEASGNESLRELLLAKTSIVYNDPNETVISWWDGSFVTTIRTFDEDFTPYVMPCAGSVKFEHRRGSAAFANTLRITPKDAVKDDGTVLTTPVLLSPGDPGTSVVEFEDMRVGSQFQIALLPRGVNYPELLPPFAQGQALVFGDKRLEIKWEDTYVPPAPPSERKTFPFLLKGYGVYQTTGAGNYDDEFELELLVTLKTTDAAPTFIDSQEAYDAIQVDPHPFANFSSREQGFPAVRTELFTSIDIEVVALRFTGPAYPGGPPKLYLLHAGFLGGERLVEVGQTYTTSGFTPVTVDGLAVQTYGLDAQVRRDVPGEITTASTLLNRNAPGLSLTFSGPVLIYRPPNLIPPPEVADYNDSTTVIFMKCGQADALQPPPFIYSHDLAARLDGFRVRYE